MQQYPTLHTGTLEHSSFKVEYMACIPPDTPKAIAVFTHGYTSHKGSVLPWAQRLSENGVASLVFDLPGHFLGSFRDLDSFESFTSHAPELFIKAIEKVKELSKYSGTKLFMGGHSLGALVSLKAANQVHALGFDDMTLFVVGFGLAPEKGKHVFESDFYKSTLAFRRQLVSKQLAPEKIFPWIWDEKWHIQLTDQNIIFLTGKDDVVVAKDGSERLSEQLERLGNEVKLIRPTRLPHHMPELAASHIFAQIKKIL